MAYADYLHCAICGKKVIYDAEMDYEAATGGRGQLYDIAALCKTCAKTHSLVVVKTPSQRRIADFLD